MVAGRQLSQGGVFDWKGKHSLKLNTVFQGKEQWPHHVIDITSQGSLVSSVGSYTQVHAAGRAGGNLFDGGLIRSV